MISSRYRKYVSVKENNKTIKREIPERYQMTTLIEFLHPCSKKERMTIN